IIRSMVLKTSLLTTLAGVLGVLGMTSTAVIAQDEVDDEAAVYAYEPDWVDLGCQRTMPGYDNGVIPVTQRDGRFDALRLAVRDGDLDLSDLDVIYRDGSAEDVPLGTRLRTGDRTIPLLLRGGDHPIARIEVLYRVV